MDYTYWIRNLPGGSWTNVSRAQYEALQRRCSRKTTYRFYLDRFFTAEEEGKMCVDYPSIEESEDSIHKARREGFIAGIKAAAAYVDKHPLEVKISENMTLSVKLDSVYEGICRLENE